jgi:dTDP-4-dehydrorhamnose 3,5-epimerase-like enzyme
MKNSNLIEFNVLGDYRGQLVALENNNNIPFDMQRVFYIYGTQDGIPRGNHSHYKTKQLLVAVSGSCKVTLDNGTSKETYTLDKPNIALFQDALIWGVMHDFSSDCVLMVLADTPYEESDYIRDYNMFLKEINNENS